MRLNIDAPLVVIVGPTAVGKTILSIELARRLSGEILSADSRLFYKGMDMGTAKPTLQARQEIPHHLIDIVLLDENFSLPLFQQKAYALIDQIHSWGNLPFLVGGTGQYIWAVVEGWKPPVVIPNNRMRTALFTWGSVIGAEELHRRLGILDPEAADKIQPKNLRRTIRALEVILSTGKLFSSQRRKQAPPYTIKIIGLERPREELYRRIDNRIDAMIKSGLVEEVEQLLASGFTANLPTMSAIGYQEIALFLGGQISLDDAVILMKRRTRKFVRHQSNWFKKTDSRIKWFNMKENAVDLVEEYIRSSRGWQNPKK
ncbi:MAG TPA: tRNA (adenosine(37)-N6)-dimethylallyltransferase MiaA [Anaerolineae bacterium]|nr:tRNA (adenosine(37)-N6)-dimethylallyltransferase MiaA [Anaerolineae bacterium]